MFDYRYHALSLVGIFLALAVGLLLGVAIGDRGLVSSAERDVRGSLRADVRKAQAEADRLRRELADRDRFETDAYPLMVGGRLSGQRIGLVALGGVSDDAVSDVREALEQTGGRLVSVAVVRIPIDLERLGPRLAGTRYAQLPQAPQLLERFGQRIGAGMVEGGGLFAKVRPALLQSSSGSFNGLDAVVLVRQPKPLPPAARAPSAAYERGLLTGLTVNDHTVVGVEATSTRPSQVPWFRDRDLPSVDNIDQLPGHISLVFALNGADGAYGVKPTADALLPRAASELPPPPSE